MSGLVDCITSRMGASCDAGGLSILITEIALSIWRFKNKNRLTMDFEAQGRFASAASALMGTGVWSDCEFASYQHLKRRSCPVEIVH